MSGNTINDMVAQYLHGCKLYCVFSKKAQMLAVIKALDTALTQRGLVRNRDNIEIAFDEQKAILLWLSLLGICSWDSIVP